MRASELHARAIRFAPLEKAIKSTKFATKVRQNRSRVKEVGKKADANAGRFLFAAFRR